MKGSGGEKGSRKGKGNGEGKGGDKPDFTRIDARI